MQSSQRWTANSLVDDDLLSAPGALGAASLLRRARSRRILGAFAICFRLSKNCKLGSHALISVEGRVRATRDAGRRPCAFGADLGWAPPSISWG